MKSASVITRISSVTDLHLLSKFTFDREKQVLAFRFLPKVVSFRLKNELLRSPALCHIWFRRQKYFAFELAVGFEEGGRLTDYSGYINHGEVA